MGLGFTHREQHLDVARRFLAVARQQD